MKNGELLKSHNRVDTKLLIIKKMNFNIKKLIYLFAIVLFALNFTTAKSQCNCNFEYEIEANPTNGTFNNYDITIDISTNGDYELNGDINANIEVCYSEHPNDTNINFPYEETISITGSQNILFTIENLNTGCEETINYTLPYPASPQDIASCDEGCIVNRCDLWFDVKPDRIYGYKYPHQGENTLIQYREQGNTSSNYIWTDRHYFKIKPITSCTTYEIRFIKLCGTSWSNWSEWREVETGCPKIGNPFTDESKKVSLNTHNIDVYPNPSNGNFNLKISAEENIKGGELEIYNLSGKLVYSNLLKFENNNAKINLDKEQIANGMYLAKIISGKHILTTEILIQN